MLFPLFHFGPRFKKTFSLISTDRMRGVLSVGLAVLLLIAPLSLTISGQQPVRAPKVPNGEHFVFYRDANGDFACREATLEEARELDQIKPQGLRQITHLADSQGKGLNATADNVDNLTIILRATATLDANAPAKAAFIRAAQVWEAQIKSPITIYLDVHFGPKEADDSDWPAGTIGSTSTFSTNSLYPTLRNQLIAGASTAAETSLYNSLPASALPTNQGDATSASVSHAIARTLGLLDPTAQPGDAAPSIGFNSAFEYDFDPNDGSDGPGGDGIDAGKTDFEAVAVHEIGHALGFTSRAGRTPSPSPAVWDVFRFRTGTTLGTFSSAQRIMTADGLQFYFSGPAEVGLSTGGVDGDAPDGDGNQSSHWKQQNLNGGIYIGIMDPKIASGVRRQITLNDTIALDSFGYNLNNSSPPPPPPPPPAAPPNNDFANAQIIAGCSGSVTGTNIGANKEAGEPSHSPDDNAGGGSVWYSWQAPSSGSVTITTQGSNYDTLLGVYTGASVNALTPIAKNDDVDLGVVLSSSVTFDAIAGTIYRIAVDGWGGDAGNIVLNWTQSNCPAPTPSPSPTPTPNVVQFDATAYAFGEGNGTAQINVTRTDTTAGATVDFATSDTAALQECDVINSIASSRCDYATTIGTLRFAAGEASKTIFVPLVDDSYAEGNETFNITLSNPTGTTLGSPTTATITIQDNETVNGANPIGANDFFIRQQYIDFLGREPDPPGLAGWRSILNNCPPSGRDANGNFCDRIEVSAGFFRSAEFQERGYFIYRFYPTMGVGGEPRIPLYPEFMPDFAKVSGFLTAQQLEDNKVAFVIEFMARTEFQNKYSSTFGNPTQYVDTLLQTVGLPSHPSRQAWIDLLNSNNSAATRGQVLRGLVESGQLYDKYYNQAFVIMQYFGYLRRTADASYRSWIQTMDSTGDYRVMINGFLNSLEYPKRFGP